MDRVAFTRNTLRDFVSHICFQNHSITSTGGSDLLILCAVGSYAVSLAIGQIQGVIAFFTLCGQDDSTFVLTVQLQSQRVGMLLLFGQGEIGITGNRPALKAIRGSNGDFLLTDNTGGGHAIYSAAIHSYPTDSRVLLTKVCVTAEYTAFNCAIVGKVTCGSDILNSAIVGYTISDDAVLEYAVICDTPFYCIVFKISSVCLLYTSDAADEL